MVRHLMFAGRVLWVIGRRWRWARLYDVTTPTAPVELARLDEAGAAWAKRLFLGSHLLTYQGRNLVLEQAQADQ